MLTCNELISKFKELGIKNGDVILLHSSFKSLGTVSNGPGDVIDALLHILGKNGTLIVPTFNFDFCKGNSFNVNETPSQMGIITEFVRKNRDSVRTKDPVYSFAIMGKLKERLGNLVYDSCYGNDSMFAQLRKYDGKIVIIGLAYNDSMTFFHHIEEMEGCDYRYFKEFNGNVINLNGIKQKTRIKIFVRNLEKKVETDVDKMGIILENNGLVNKIKIGNADVKILDANQVYIRTAKELKNNPHILCKFNS
jgi:aminoglycoside N3'-acetyltransferase|tara:strand:- start:2382 stop:3134 length:753 start_codon:yes stop_codon:yes gene_type:complete